MMYFADLDPSNGNLLELTMTGTRTKHFQVTKSEGKDLEWLYDTIRREANTKFGHKVTLSEETGQMEFVP